MTDDSVSTRVRREPPRFREVTVDAVDYLSPRMARVTLAGDDLDGLAVEQPAASVRLLFPPPGEDQLVMPRWDGNQFLHDDGSRPLIRTFTPRSMDDEALELELWVVVHGDGAASTWVRTASRGDPAAVSGPGRGYEVPTGAASFLLAGDETAIPAMSQLLEVIPESTPVEVLVEAGDPEAKFSFADHPSATIRWHHQPPDGVPGDALGPAIEAAEIGDGARIWAAGEAGAMQRIRRHLFEDRGLSRREAVVRGYWKHGRGGE